MGHAAAQPPQHGQALLAQQPVLGLLQLLHHLLLFLRILPECPLALLAFGDVHHHAGEPDELFVVVQQRLDGEVVKVRPAVDGDPQTFTNPLARLHHLALELGQPGCLCRGEQVGVQSAKDRVVGDVGVTVVDPGVAQVQIVLEDRHGSVLQDHAEPPLALSQRRSAAADPVALLHEALVGLGQLRGPLSDLAVQLVAGHTELLLDAAPTRDVRHVAHVLDVRALAVAVKEGAGQEMNRSTGRLGQGDLEVVEVALLLELFDDLFPGLLGLVQPGSRLADQLVRAGAAEDFGGGPVGVQDGAVRARGDDPLPGVIDDGPEAMALLLERSRPLSQLGLHLLHRRHTVLQGL